MPITIDNAEGPVNTKLDPVQIVYEMMQRIATSSRAHFGDDGKAPAWSRIDAARSPLAENLRVVITNPPRHSKTRVGYAATQVLFALTTFSAPDPLPLIGEPRLGPNFHKTALGQAVLKAMLYAEDDELISLTEAAKLAKRSVSSMSQYVSRGALIGYPDPVVPNRMFVRRKKVEQFVKVKKATARGRAVDKSKK